MPTKTNETSPLPPLPRKIRGSETATRLVLLWAQVAAESKSWNAKFEEGQLEFAETQAKLSTLAAQLKDVRDVARAAATVLVIDDGDGVVVGSAVPVAAAVVDADMAVAVVAIDVGSV